MKTHQISIRPTFLWSIVAVAALSAASAAVASEAAPSLFQFVEAPIAEASLGPAAVEARRVAIDREAITDAAPELEIELLDGASYRARLTDFERRGAVDVSWWGRLDKPNGGRVILSLKNGFLAGTIFAPASLHSTETYKVAPLPDGGQALVALDPGLFPPCEGGLEPPLEVTVEEPASADLPPQPEKRQEKGESITLDVMSLYTPQALAGAGGVGQIHAEIQAGVDEANVAFLDSEMIARFRLVHTALAARNDSGIISSDLNWLTDDPRVAALRDATSPT